MKVGGQFGDEAIFALGSAPIDHGGGVGLVTVTVVNLGWRTMPGCTPGAAHVR